MPIIGDGHQIGDERSFYDFLAGLSDDGPATKRVLVTREKLIEQMEKATSIDRLNKLISEIATIVMEKNHDYGDAWQKYGVFTALIRLNDKLLRLQTLSSGEPALVADESINQTIVDIAGYSILAMTWLQENGNS